jgi:hypothetical protein
VQAFDFGRFLGVLILVPGPRFGRFVPGYFVPGSSFLDSRFGRFVPGFSFLAFGFWRV